jgi:uncharacterized protein (DUF697 family)
MSTIRVCTSELVAGECPVGAEAWVSALDLVPLVDLGITTATVTSVWTWGFGAVLFFYFIGFKAGVALGVIRRV